MKYSIVIPAYNEAAVIEGFVDAFIESLPAAVRTVLVELIIVENGSRDGTLAAARRLEARHPGIVQVFSNDRPSYGEAIKRGMLESQGSHLSILEVDSLDGDFVARSIAAFARGTTSFIVASKRHPGSADRRPLLRRQLTAAYNWILRVATGYPGSDTHGHKSIESGLAKRLCGLAVTSDESLQTEIVLIAWRLGETIVELPLVLEESRQPAVSILRRLPKVLNSMTELRRSLRRFPSRSGIVSR